MMPNKVTVRLDPLHELDAEYPSEITLLSDSLFQTDVHLQIFQKGMEISVCVNANELRRAIESVTR